MKLMAAGQLRRPAPPKLTSHVIWFLVCIEAEWNREKLLRSLGLDDDGDVEDARTSERLPSPLAGLHVWLAASRMELWKARCAAFSHRNLLLDSFRFPSSSPGKAGTPTADAKSRWSRLYGGRAAERG